METPERDPVCGMIVSPSRGLRHSYEDRSYVFCSEYCRELFLKYPKRYVTSGAIQESDIAHERKVAYFSMEIALERDIPTYSGGLGVLAGDSLRSFADLRVPIVGVSLLFRKGYFDQILGANGKQEEHPVDFTPKPPLQALSHIVEVEIERRRVRVMAWQYEIVGLTGYRVPILLLDTDIEGNSNYDRALTGSLYGGDSAYRLGQEIVLGIGGLRMLRAAGYNGIQKYHMNEGHAALLSLELLAWEGGSEKRTWDFNGVRNRTIFTTHTPVPAGHDEFDYESVDRILGPVLPSDVLRMLAGQDRLNMTVLALNLSGYENGVAKRHQEVSREMFPGYPIQSITNGVHSLTWTSESFKRLYDRYLLDWRNDPAMLRKALSIPDEGLWNAHMEAKDELLTYVQNHSGKALSREAFTIGFGRRATVYKRANLVFTDMARLAEIARKNGPVQFVFAGKAHPKDQPGKDLIEHIFRVAREMEQSIPIIYLENYDTDIAKLMVSGVDLWLNTPLRPLEASGTSGMKAAHNGVPSLSTLDGWWNEGCIEGMTGWSIGSAGSESSDQDAGDLYDKLEAVILPMFYKDRRGWLKVMRQAIALNAAFFNTHRMVQEYVSNAYLP